MLLAGDIGGTKTNLAVFSHAEGIDAPLAIATFPSRRYASLDVLVKEFLAQVDIAIDHACFGVAGPVVAGKVATTNLPWTISESQLQETLSLSSVQLLNDLAAIAYAAPFLKPEDLHTLNEGEAVPGGALAVIAPGTGLGEGFLTWAGARYNTHPSEGGHAGFAPMDALQVDLLRYLMDRFDHVSFERVCSGVGIPNIYAFLRDSGHAPEPEWLAKQLAMADDPNPVIARAALAGECELCVATFNVFVSIMGAEAGNLALKVLATGGVYVGGGIPPRILPLLQSERFMEAFTHKGRFSDLLSRVPVYVILNPKAALLGAACYGLDLQPR
jgi:glucokinase